MTITRSAQPGRRPPPPAERYRALARSVRAKRARRPLPPLVRGLIWGIVLATALLVADAVATSANRTGSTIDNWVTTAVAVPEATANLTVSETSGQVGAAPLLDAVPEYTKDPALLLQGIVPSFSIEADRKIAVQANGTTATVKFDASGHFAVPLTLRDGPNHLVIALIGPASETIATTGITVTLDRVAPPLTLTKPANGATIDSSTVTVEGKAEPGAIVLVNDRSVIVGQDGSFSDSATAQAGVLPITVIARDRAGNETKTQLSVTVAPKATAGAAATIAVSLANSTVRPGGFVSASITVSNAGAPQAGVTVSLQVGVVPIGTAVTDASGHATISFAAPPNEGIAQVVVLAGAATGSATLTVAK